MAAAYVYKIQLVIFHIFMKTAYEAGEVAQLRASAIHQTKICTFITFSCLSTLIPWSQQFI